MIRIYECLCDETRLRILHLLSYTALCVCHFQGILGAPQVKISKHLYYLKRRGLVESTRYRNWQVYRLPNRPSDELKQQLQCLQDCVHEVPVFKRDLARLKRIASQARRIVTCCGEKEKAVR